MSTIPLNPPSALEATASSLYLSSTSSGTTATTTASVASSSSSSSSSSLAVPLLSSESLLSSSSTFDGIPMLHNANPVITNPKIISSSSSTVVPNDNESFEFPSMALTEAFTAIRDLQSMITNEGIPDYLNQFNEQVKLDTITVGLLSKEEIERRKTDLEESRAKEETERLVAHQHRLERVRRAEAEARKRLETARRILETYIILGTKEHQDYNKIREAQIYHVYERAYQDLRKRISSYQGYIQSKFGELITIPASNDPSTVISSTITAAAYATGLGRQLKVDWTKLPQTVEFRISRMRAVKNKLPDGLYVLMVSLYNRLGGTSMKWSNLPIGFGAPPLYNLNKVKRDNTGGQDTDNTSNTDNDDNGDRPAATTAVRHRGRFYDTEMVFNQCIYGTSPPPVDLRPYNVWIFELYLLGGRTQPMDRVVAWGALPASTQDITSVMGKYRIPLLRGEINPNFDRYSSIENEIGKNLDVWLANLYVEAVLLPRTATVTSIGRETIRKSPTNMDNTTSSSISSKLITPTINLPGIGLRRRKIREWDVEVAYTSSLLRIRNEARAAKAISGPNAPIAPNAEMVPSVDPTIKALDGSKNNTLTDVMYVGNYDDEVMDMHGETVKEHSNNNTEDDKHEHDLGSLVTTAESPLQLTPPHPDTRLIGGTIAHTVNNINSGTASKFMLEDTETWLDDGIASLSGTRNLLLTKHTLESPFAAELSRLGILTGNAGVPNHHQQNSPVGGARITSVSPGTVTAERVPVPTTASPTVQSSSSSSSIPTTPSSVFRNTNTLPLSAFSYAVNKNEEQGIRGKALANTTRKLFFVKQGISGDLHWRNAGTVDFWVQIMQVLVALWLRTYVHYLGQYAYLRALKIPVYAFVPLLYTIDMRYVPDALPNEIEIGTILIGPLTVIILFAIGCGLSWLTQKVLGTFPEAPSRFIAFFGAAAVVDPFLIALVDFIAGRYHCTTQYPECAIDLTSSLCTCTEGDAWRLPARFSKQEGSGVPGAVLTAVLYLLLSTIAAVGLYTYILQLHMNGRVLDGYRRVAGTEDRFMVPQDYEISPAELVSIVNRAQRWRGNNNVRRRIAVCDYILTDPYDPKWSETTTHLIIYTAIPDSPRQLYRHFLRNPDGTLLEIFGDLERYLDAGLITAAPPALASVLLAQAQTVDEGGDGKKTLAKDFFQHI